MLLYTFYPKFLGHGLSFSALLMTSLLLMLNEELKAVFINIKNSFISNNARDMLIITTLIDVACHRVGDLQ